MKKILTILLLGPVLGTLIHEAGHLMVYQLTETAIVSVVVLGKYQLYPDFAVVENMGAGFMIQSVFPDYTARGMGSLGGVMVTLPVSIAGLALYGRKRTLARLVFAFYVLDLLSYVIVPGLGLRRWIVFGAPYSEVLMGAELLHLPLKPLILGSALYSAFHFAAVAYLWRRAGADSGKPLAATALSERIGTPDQSSVSS